MFNFIKNLFDPNQAAIKEVIPIVDETLAKEAEVKKMSFAQMQKRVEAIRAEIKPLLKKVSEQEMTSLRSHDPKDFPADERELQSKVQSFIPEFFAMMREVNARKFKKPHFKVQLISATILAQGHKLTELKTGEGKTQVFQLPAALYGLTGRGSHVITVNDYLARRDGEYAGHAMADMGITVGVITPQASYRFVPDDKLAEVKGEEAVKERADLNIANLSDMHGTNLVECTKHEAYNLDVVYGTNNEFGFDYLRDNMVYDLRDRVQRELYFCIVDEADSILIDEARTPLIISAPAEASNELYQRFADIAKKLTPEKHFTVDEKTHSVNLTEDGTEYVETLLGVKNLWEDYRLAHHLDNAMKAEALYKLDDEYIVKNGEVLIVDEFTGRVLAGRRYSEGLHQAIEAKEGVDIKRESKTMATITFQNFFKLYKILSGGSGTIITEAEEFMKIYNLESYVIPTNKDLIRADKNDKIYKHKQAKFEAVANEIEQIHGVGQPILVGTTSVENSEILSSLLDKRGIVHEVLNAKFHEREAQVVAKAGQKNAVTVATNMAGRGTDIALTPEVVGLGGLYIIGTERHEARRIDNQLRGRGGRQGDPGTTQFFVALDDEIMRIQGGDVVKRIMEFTKIPDDIPIESGMVSRAIESAQKKMEGYHFDIRKRLVDYDNVMNQQREIFYTRRYNLIELTESAEKSSGEAKQAKMKEIRAQMLEILDTEVSAIVMKHFQAEGIDAESKLSLMNDFADLCVDKLIFRAFAEEFKDKVAKLSEKQKNSLPGLAELLANNPTDITDMLSRVAEKVLDYKVEEFGDNLPEIYRLTALQNMDELWTDHLDAIGDLREGIGLRGYAQRDPLVEYKNEGFALFERFIESINSGIARRFLKIQRLNSPVKQERLVTNENQISDVLTGTREMVVKGELPKIATNAQDGPARPVVNTKKQIGRNDPCPCGSGLKYKKCGMINAPQHKA